MRKVLVAPAHAREMILIGRVARRVSVTAEELSGAGVGDGRNVLHAAGEAMSQRCHVYLLIVLAAGLTTLGPAAPVAVRATGNLVVRNVNAEGVEPELDAPVQTITMMGVFDHRTAKVTLQSPQRWGVNLEFEADHLKPTVRYVGNVTSLYLEATQYPTRVPDFLAMVFPALLTWRLRFDSEIEKRIEETSRTLWRYRRSGRGERLHVTHVATSFATSTLHRRYALLKPEDSFDLDQRRLYMAIETSGMLNYREVGLLPAHWESVWYLMDKTTREITPALAFVGEITEVQCPPTDAFLREYESLRSRMAPWRPPREPYAPRKTFPYRVVLFIAGWGVIAVALVMRYRATPRT